MNVKALLNTDVSTLFQGVQRLWAWWIGELQALMPSSWRPSVSAKARLVAELKDGKLLFREYRRGSAVAVPRLGPPERLLARAFFALPPGAVLVREASFPQLPAADLRRMAALDMDRLTPFRNEDVVFDLDIQPGRVEGKMRQVTVAVVRRKILDDILARLWSFGAEPLAVGLIDRHDGIPRFDFLTAAEVPGRRPLLGLEPTYWWLLVAFLFIGNLALLAAKDAYSVANLRTVVEAQRSSVVLASSLRRRVELETRKRGVVLNSLKRASPLAILDAATKALPDGVSVRKLEWNGKEVHLVGAAPPDVDVPALVNASALAKGMNASETPSNPHAKRIGIMPGHPSATVAAGSARKELSPPQGSATPQATAAKAPSAVIPVPSASVATGMFDVTVALKDVP